MNVVLDNFGRGLKKGILLHIHVEDFITYPWILRTHFLDFIRIFESQKSETMSKLPKKSEKVQIEGEQRRIATIYLFAVEILLHIHVEDFITYLWTPRTHFLDFI